MICRCSSIYQIQNLVQIKGICLCGVTVGVAAPALPSLDLAFHDLGHHMWSKNILYPNFYNVFETTYIL